eukprot:COSAG02_NODE_5922_length_3939_cov_1.951042_2_plen_195_part_00
MTPALARGAALEHVVLTLLWQCERTSDIVPSTEMQTVGTLVNLRVLPSVAWVRNHALATTSRQIVAIIARGRQALGSKSTVRHPSGAPQFGQCGQVPPALHFLCGPSLLHCPGVLSSGQNVPGVPGCKIGHGQLFGSVAATPSTRSSRIMNLGRAAAFRTVVHPGGGFGPPVDALAAATRERVTGSTSMAEVGT